MLHYHCKALATQIKQWESQSSELPSLQFKETMPVMELLHKHSLLGASVNSSEDVKSTLTEYKGHVNMLGLVKTSLRCACDKYKTFRKERLATEERQKAEREKAESALVKAESKRKAAEEKRLTRAAEKIGRVSTCFEIDVAKLGVRPLMVQDATAEKVKALDWNRPWLMRSDDSTSCLPSVHQTLQDASVTACLGSYQGGFPGSAAAMQGAKRFSSLVAGADILQSKVMSELGAPSVSVPVEWEQLTKQTTGVHAWAYGEDMLSYSLDLWGKDVVLCVCLLHVLVLKEEHE
eukprot:6479273-Amphidinium_carterae.2